MKVFISWSEERSKGVAEILRNWVKSTIQASQPFISTRDIDSGSMWFNKVAEELRDTTVGIFCLTPESKDKPWILFEAGALSKGLATSRVCTFLIGLKATDVKGPLTQFNHTEPTRDSMRKLANTLNEQQEGNRLSESELDVAFNAFWPQFDDAYQKLLKTSPKPVPSPHRSDADVLDEILRNTRGIERRLAQIEVDSSPLRVPRDAFAGRFREWAEVGPDDTEFLQRRNRVYKQQDADLMIRAWVRDRAPDDEIRRIMRRIDVPSEFVEARIKFWRDEADKFGFAPAPAPAPAPKAKPSSDGAG